MATLRCVKAVPIGPPQPGSTKEALMSQAWIEKSVGELVLEKPSRSKVFEKVGLDYCCKGHQALGVACAEKGVELGAILQALEAQDAAARRALTSLWADPDPEIDLVEPPAGPTLTAAIDPTASLDVRLAQAEREAAQAVRRRR